MPLKAIHGANTGSASKPFFEFVDLNVEGGNNKDLAAVNQSFLRVSFFVDGVVASMQRIDQLLDAIDLLRCVNASACVLHLFKHKPLFR